MVILQSSAQMAGNRAGWAQCLPDIHDPQHHMNQAWGYMSVISACGRWRQETQEFQGHYWLHQEFKYSQGLYENQPQQNKTKPPNQKQKPYKIII